MIISQIISYCAVWLSIKYTAEVHLRIQSNLCQLQVHSSVVKHREARSTAGIIFKKQLEPITDKERKKNKSTKKPRNSGQSIDAVFQDSGVLEIPQQENQNKKTAWAWCS